MIEYNQILDQEGNPYMKILVTGAQGFVGSKIMNMVKGTVAAPSLRSMTEDDIRRLIGESGADTIIHTAAISDMDICESDPEASYRANVQIPVWLAKASEGRKLICFSSDQVYNASPEPGPYKEGDEVPGNTYARHKLEMEHKVLDILPSSVMLRAEWMYDHNAARPNYILYMLNAKDKMSFSSSQFRGVTYLTEVAENMDKVIELPGGSYNYGSETDISLYEITKRFAEYIGKDITVEDKPAEHNLWMDCSKARRYGVVFSSVPDGLIRCADDYHLNV